MSEKLDGVRGKWDGRAMFNRHGKSNGWVSLNAPAFVREYFAGLPAVEFEIWHGRGNYRETMKLFQLADPSAVWASARFGIFDAPDFAGTIEARSDFLQSLPVRGPVFTLNHEVCRSLAHLKARFTSVYDGGGEGLVISKPGSAYENGRTTKLLKVKCRWW